MNREVFNVLPALSAVVGAGPGGRGDEVTAMGIMGRVKDMMHRHGDRTGRGTERAGGTADTRTGGRHRRPTGTGGGRARRAAERISRERRGRGGPAA
ncbi:hypothetical protein CUT44_00395 [Streptomyces carminius]|uniref:Uncharacterized protein n=1 Tax=Streptomyces carminius TaxID=2665496 RepID=A0A2M8MCW8_9ACTN|nr:antitoxin [Streptomyces carminius]PJF02058.1 hypothetical protein CUT44_00395 [Streptomyces carminius]